MSVFLWPIKLFHTWWVWKKTPHQFKLDIESKFNVETSIMIRMRIVMINSMTKTKTWQWKELWWRTNIRSFDFVSWKNSNCNCKFWVESSIFTMSVCVSLRPRDIFLLRNNFLLLFLHFLFLCRLNIVLPFLLSFSSPLRAEYIPSPNIFLPFLLRLSSPRCRPNIFLLQMFSSQDRKKFPHQI